MANPTSPQRIVIIGGVAGGASAAARARRLSESAQITVFERGHHVSFANCGLPYYLGRDITDHDDLLLHTPQSLKARFNLDVKTRHEVLSVNPAAKTVQVQNLETHAVFDEPYDALLLAPGAAPLVPPFPGKDRPGIFTLRNITDMDAIDAWIEQNKAKQAVVIGGGFIGLEVAEQFQHRGLAVTVVEASPQIMAPLDPEMAAILEAELTHHGLGVVTNNPVSSFEAPLSGEPSAQSAMVVLKDGTRLPADVVVMGIGVRPETKLAKDAGLTIGDLGGIRVNETMQTSDPNIWAVGDAVEVMHPLSGKWSLIPLAGPANRQARIAVEAMFGQPRAYKGTVGTAILRVFRQTAGGVGLNEKQLKQLGLPYEAVHLHPKSHAGYYPGAKPIALKLTFNPTTGQIWGAQAVGQDGVDKRIDVLATAIQARLTVADLAELELAYAPPVGSAKDPVNLAGMIAYNIQTGQLRQIQWDAVGQLDNVTLVDVRDEDEFADGHLPNAVNIPLNQLRQRLSELKPEHPVVVYCQSGQRSYYATRILMLNGFSDVRNLSGAYATWKQGQAVQNAPVLQATR